jgi:flagellar basal-body rod protein FlgF
MSTLGHVTLSRQMVLRSQLDSIAHNIANAETPSFKGRHTFLVEKVARPPQGDAISFVSTIADLRDFSEGPLKTTGGELDLAIRGAGFFKVDNGFTTQYTRNGSFELDFDGQLTTKSGSLVLDTNDRPIVIPPDAGPVAIARDGTVSGPAGVLGTIKVVTFDDPNSLTDAGDTLYTASQPEIEAEGHEIHQGVLETANVQAVMEITRMIEVLRAYQSVQRITEQNHDLSRQTIQKLTEVN